MILDKYFLEVNSQSLTTSQPPQLECITSFWTCHALLNHTRICRHANNMSVGRWLWYFESANARADTVSFNLQLIRDGRDGVRGVVSWTENKICPRLSEVLQYRGHVWDHSTLAGKPDEGDEDRLASEIFLIIWFGTNIPNLRDQAEKNWYYTWS